MASTVSFTEADREHQFDCSLDKQRANKAAREFFSRDYDGYVVGLLGFTDIEYYLSRGIDPSNIISVENDPAGFQSLCNHLHKKGLGHVKVIEGDVFKFIASLPDRSISAIFLDMIDWKYLVPLDKWGRTDETVLVNLAAKLNDSFHFHVTYPARNSGAFKSRHAQRNLRDIFFKGGEIADTIHQVVRDVMVKRGVYVSSFMAEQYSGIGKRVRGEKVTYNHTTPMITSSFVGLPA